MAAASGLPSVRARTTSTSDRPSASPLNPMRPARRTCFVLCRGCDARINDVCGAVGLAVWRVRDVVLSIAASDARREVAPAEPLPTEAELDESQDRLIRSPKRLAFLTHHRGLDRRTIVEHRLGWDGDRYVLPVY